MKVNFKFEDKDIKVNFENNYRLKEQTTEKGIKVLMLKGEKGDPGIGGAEWGGITGTLSKQTDLQNVLNEKANNTDIPTKTSELENDTNYAKKEDIPDVSNFITNSVNDLINYYKKNETYNRTEINQMVSAIPKFAIEVIEKLPTTKISNTTIYLLTSGAEEKNLYTEYIYVNNSWEKLGTQTVDLTDYYTKTEINSLLANIDLSSYYTKTETYSKTETNNLLNNKLNITDLISFVYPVGSIYMSVNNVSPATFIGGTWEQIKDRFLLSAGDTYLAGDTGGSATHSHSLSRNAGANFRKFANIFIQGESTLAGVIQRESEANKYWITEGNSDYSADTPEKPGVSLYGNTDATTNLPPYLAVYMWKRTS